MTMAMLRMVLPCLVILVASHATAAADYLRPMATQSSVSTVEGVIFPIPLNVQRRISKFQSLYHANDLKTAGFASGTILRNVGLEIADVTANPSYTRNNVRVAIQALSPSDTLLTQYIDPCTTFKRPILQPVVAGPVPVPGPALSTRQPYVIDFSQPFTYDGTSSLLVELSMDNDGTTSLDKTRLNLKNTPAGSKSKSAFGYVYYDDCWKTASFPFSTKSSCPSRGRPYDNAYMRAFELSIVMDLQFNAGLVTTTTNTPATTMPATTTTLPGTTTAPAPSTTTTSKLTTATTPPNTTTTSAPVTTTTAIPSTTTAMRTTTSTSSEAVVYGRMRRTRLDPPACVSADFCVDRCTRYLDVSETTSGHVVVTVTKLVPGCSCAASQGQANGLRVLLTVNTPDAEWSGDTQPTLNGRHITMAITAFGSNGSGNQTNQTCTAIFDVTSGTVLGVGVFDNCGHGGARTTILILSVSLGLLLVVIAIGIVMALGSRRCRGWRALRDQSFEDLYESDTEILGAEDSGSSA